MPLQGMSRHYHNQKNIYNSCTKYPIIFLNLYMKIYSSMKKYSFSQSAIVFWLKAQKNILFYKKMYIPGSRELNLKIIIK